MSLWPRSPAWDDPFFRDTFDRFGRFDRSMFPYWRTADPSIVSVANETQQMINNDQKFAVSLDVSQFRPDELRVQLQGRELVIEGKQENKGDGNYMERSFVRKWTLPPDVDVEGIRSDLNSAGHLSVEAP
ncbi:Hsp20/alpha crystallin family protein, partial [Oesophagostomum dentatum]